MRWFLAISAFVAGASAASAATGCPPIGYAYTIENATPAFAAFAPPWLAPCEPPNRRPVTSPCLCPKNALVIDRNPACLEYLGLQDTAAWYSHIAFVTIPQIRNARGVCVPNDAQSRQPFPFAQQRGAPALSAGPRVEAARPVAAPRLGMNRPAAAPVHPGKP